MVYPTNVAEWLEDIYCDAEPVREVVVSPDRLFVPWSKADVDSAPTTRPGEKLSLEDEERVFRRYGLDYELPVSSSGRRLVRR